MEQGAAGTAAREANEGEQREEDDEWLMSCRCASAKAISTLLSCLHHRDGGSSIGGGIAAVEGASQHHQNSRNNNNNSQLTTGAGSGPTRRARNRGAPQLVTVFCNQKCLTFHVHGTSKQFQASVDIQASWFTHYRVAQCVATPLTCPEELERGDGEEIQTQASVGSEFCVNLTTVLDCLHVLGTTQALERTQVCMSYNSTQEYLKLELLLEHCGVLSTATIPGMIPPDADDDDDNNEDDTTGHGLHLAFRSSPIVARMIVQSEILRQMVPELEAVMGATIGTVALSKHNGLEIATVGHLGECLVSIPGKGSHIVMFEIHHHQQELAATTARRKEKQRIITSNFPLHSLMASFRGLEMAQETCLTMNANGMMAIQHQVLLNASDIPEMGTVDPSNTVTPCFVEFILCCLQDDDDDNSDDSDSREEKEEDGEDQRQRHQSRMTSASQLSSQDEEAAASLRTYPRADSAREERSVTSFPTTATATTTTRRKEASQKSTTSTYGDDDDDREEDDESSHLPNMLFNNSLLLDQSSISLQNDDVALSSKRRQRRRLGRNTKETRSAKKDETKNDNKGREDNKTASIAANSKHDNESESESDSARSRNLLQDSDDDGEAAANEEATALVVAAACSATQRTNEDVDVDLSQPLDVTAPAASHSTTHTRRRRRHGGNDYDDDDNEEGCSSPEIVYGPQH